MLANACPDPERVVVGLSELIINAIEHGNLGITYEEKTRLNQDGEWLREVERRLQSEEYADKRVVVDFERGPLSIRIRIADEGAGFDWHGYVDPDPERAFDNHGRGIAMSKLLYFDSLEYHGKGNEVTVEVFLSDAMAVV
jgi:anti-sigma regulatory factor (Ser/Thr protein kinase)